MTVTEWADVVRWVEERWPDRPWTAEQAAAYFEDLGQFDAADVWQAMLQHYAKTDTASFPPKNLYALTIQVARSNTQPGLPVSDDDEQAVYWPEYAALTYGRPVTFREAVRMQHQLQASCNSALCDIHRGEAT